MKKMIFITGIALITFNAQTMANELDALGDIQLVDESDKSALFQKGPIVGCTDYSKKKELSCSKKPEDAILSKLPTSQQLEDKDLEDEDDANEIKDQLSAILNELSALKAEQKANRNTIKELRSLVKVLSDKRIHPPKQKMAIVKKTIRKMSKKVPKQYRTTRIRKPIKEIEVYDDHVVIEVQNNESLSTYAQAYYHDNTQYYRIYKANRDKIGKDLQIIIGDRLVIPGTTSYKAR
jgi:predicted nuclease with TOPRIM domain